MINLNPEQIIQFLLQIQFWDVVKALVCFALFIYVLIALVVVKQVNMMAEVINGQMNPLIKIVAMIHFAGAILVLLIAIMVL
jgi:hypothetical protein